MNQSDDGDLIVLGRKRGGGNQHEEKNMSEHLLDESDSLWAV
jgi:hypothetical protein